MEQLTAEKLGSALRLKEKLAREEAVKTVSKEIMGHFLPEGEANPRFNKTDVKGSFKKAQAQLMRKMILDERVRSDGRTCDQVRAIDVELSPLPRTHGSALFTRGETQALAVATLGGGTMAQRSENLEGDVSSRFYLQYSFPPFSVGEVGRMGAPGRREVGHGKLA